MRIIVRIRSHKDCDCEIDITNKWAMHLLHWARINTRETFRIRHRSMWMIPKRHVPFMQVKILKLRKIWDSLLWHLIAWKEEQIIDLIVQNWFILLYQYYHLKQTSFHGNENHARILFTNVNSYLFTYHKGFI